jgi:hypothetical protein
MVLIAQKVCFFNGKKCVSYSFIHLGWHILSIQLAKMSKNQLHINYRYTKTRDACDVRDGINTENIIYCHGFCYFVKLDYLFKYKVPKILFDFINDYFMLIFLIYLIITLQSQLYTTITSRDWHRIKCHWVQTKFYVLHGLNRRYRRFLSDQKVAKRGFFKGTVSKHRIGELTDIVEKNQGTGGLPRKISWLKKKVFLYTYREWYIKRMC